MNADSKTVFDYIFGLTGGDVKLELSRVHKFMELLGHPYQAYPIIHIAGTNGKGSTASMLAAILKAYGFKTGLFTSPHLIVPNERIRVDGQLISDDFIISTVEIWRNDIDALGITFFEILTALGLVYFKEQQVDYAVLETGLGGRLDATNVVDPLLSVITSISRDHENILGSTLEMIAAEKAGIIKTGRPLVLGENSELIRDIMTRTCAQRNAKLIYAPELIKAVRTDMGLGFQRIAFSVNGSTQEIQLPLLGNHQIENFQIVIATLIEMGLDPRSDLIQKGLDDMQWWGRLQTIQAEPHVLYDVAHNPDGLARLMESLTVAGMGDAILIAAFNARKDVSRMVELLNQWSGPVLYTLFGGHSSVPVDALMALGIDPSVIDSTPRNAYQHARGLLHRKDQVICYFGSHYLAEDIFPLFGVNTAHREA